MAPQKRHIHLKETSVIGGVGFLPGRHLGPEELLPVSDGTPHDASKAGKA